MNDFVDGEMVIAHKGDPSDILPGVIGEFHGVLTLITPLGERYLHVYLNEGYIVERRSEAFRK